MSTPFSRATQHHQANNPTASFDIPEVLALLLVQLRIGDADLLNLFSAELSQAAKRRGLDPVTRGQLSMLAAVAGGSDLARLYPREEIIEEACSSLGQQFVPEHLATVGAGIALAVTTLDYQALLDLAPAIESSIALEEDLALARNWRYRPQSFDYGVLLVCQDMVNRALTYQFPHLDELTAGVLRVLQSHGKIRFTKLKKMCRRRMNLDDDQLRDILDELLAYQLIFPTGPAGSDGERAYGIAPYGRVALRSHRSPVASYLDAA